jgi:hypothetical protein
MTCCGTANATVANAAAATIAVIARVIRLWFISQKYSSGILFVECFRTLFRNLGEYLDIFNVGNILLNVCDDKCT